MPARPRFPLAELLRGAHATQFLIAANVGVFLVMAATGCMSCPDVLRRFGALVVDNGRVDGWWRVVTSAFVHFGFAHLALNMFGMTLFGPDLERRYGRVVFVTLFLCAAAAGGVATVLLDRAGLVVAAGASGGVFGLMGAWTAVLFRNRRRGAGRQFVSMAVYVGIALSLGATQPHVGNAAHLGGAVAGFALGLVAESIRRARAEARSAG